MGAGTSTHDDRSRELEARLASLGDLSALKIAFSHLSPSGPTALQFMCAVHKFIATLPKAYFNLPNLDIKEVSSSHGVEIIELGKHMGSVVVETFFQIGNKQSDWPSFLNAYEHCCMQNQTTKLKTLLSFFGKLLNKAHLSTESYLIDESSSIGRLTIDQLRHFLWLCWVLMSYTRLQDASVKVGTWTVQLPDIEAAVRACYGADKTGTLHEDSSVHEGICLGDMYAWIVTTVPAISNALVDYVRARLRDMENENKITEDKDPHEGEIFSLAQPDGLMTTGRAWTIGLSQKYSIGANLLKVACGVQHEKLNLVALLYRGSIHGKGMNRFWAQVGGYKGPVLVKFSASLAAVEPSSCSEQNNHWIIGAIIDGGFENKERFYGNSHCCLLALDPEYKVLRGTGKEKCYVYSYRHVPGTVYSSQPKREGIGFGGTSGSERIWLDDDFSLLTLRHHAVDKTYQSGSLIPNQGYAVIQGNLLEIEVWGLGGKEAEAEMLAYQKRENLFSEQRRTVDLKAFGNWEESPEKMMLNMMSDPNRDRRQDR